MLKAQREALMTFTNRMQIRFVIKDQVSEGAKKCRDLIRTCIKEGFLKENSKRQKWKKYEMTSGGWDRCGDLLRRSDDGRATRIPWFLISGPSSTGT